MSSFARLATVRFSTKRPPTLSGGKRGEPAAYLIDRYCLPLDSADPQQVRDLAVHLGLGTDAPLDILTTTVDGNLDIKEGDVLVVDSREYPIRNISSWTWRSSQFMTLLVEADDER